MVCTISLAVSLTSGSADLFRLGMEIATSAHPSLCGSPDPCKSLAMVPWKYCTSYVRDAVAFHLIALTNDLEYIWLVLGSCATRQVIWKSILWLMKDDLLEYGRSFWLRTCQETGSKSAIHVIWRVFHERENSAVFLRDATNAFNCSTREYSLDLPFTCSSFPHTGKIYMQPSIRSEPFCLVKTM